jgi:GTP:adenosylcobinamide-phosphate guanylyltransferase
MNNDEVAVNVNTPQELRIAERLLAERPSGQISHPGQRQSSLSEI